MIRTIAIRTLLAFGLLLGLCLSPGLTSAQQLTCEEDCAEQLEICENVCREHAGRAVDICLPHCQQIVAECLEECEKQQ